MESALKGIAAIAVAVSFSSAVAAQSPPIKTITALEVTPVQTPQMPLLEIMPPSASCGPRYYPPVAIRLGFEGVAVVGFTVTAKGKVVNPNIISSSGHDVLDQAAIACVSKFHYRPYMRDGQPFDTLWKYTVTWTLSDVAAPAGSR